MSCLVQNYITNYASGFYFFLLFSFSNLYLFLFLFFTPGPIAGEPRRQSPEDTGAMQVSGFISVDSGAESQRETQLGCESHSNAGLWFHSG